MPNELADAIRNLPLPSDFKDSNSAGFFELAWFRALESAAALIPATPPLPPDLEAVRDRAERFTKARQAVPEDCVVYSPNDRKAVANLLDVAKHTAMPADILALLDRLAVAEGLLREVKPWLEGGLVTLENEVDDEHGQTPSQRSITEQLIEGGKLLNRIAAQLAAGGGK